MEQMIQFFAQKEVLIILLALFVILILIYMLTRVRVSTTRKQLKELEVLFNQNKSVPLAFKLNKAIALAKTNDHLIEQVSDVKAKYDSLDQDFKAMAVMLADIEDAIIVRKNKQATLWYEAAHEQLQQMTVAVDDLDALLNGILEDEAEQRSLITKLKDEFRLCKTQLTNQKPMYAHSLETIEAQMTNIESMFSSFEAWMYASEFEKAKAKSEEIETSISALKLLLDQLPELINLTKGVIPTLIEEVAAHHAVSKQREMHVDHLDVERNLDLINQTLNDDLVQLRNGIVTDVKNHCLENEKRLLQLKVALEHEERAFDETTQLVEQLHTTLQGVEAQHKALEGQHQQFAQRYGLHSIKAFLEEKATAIKQAQTNYDDLKERFIKQQVPSSSLLVNLKDEAMVVEQLKQQLAAEHKKFFQSQSDEERAQKQLLKLHLIVNEIQVKIRKHRLPTISDSYSGDVRKAKQMTAVIEDLLQREPLDINRLNTMVNESIDFIYKLYNNVNNIVGMVDMIENGIVFANKYRSSIDFVDHELTRSELSFRNGEYTQALSIVLAAIEKLHPETFEDLIRENAKSATSGG